MKEESTFSKRDKILIVLLEMSQGKPTSLKYEDVVVSLFKKYPMDFHMRGYPEYPDSSNQSFYSLRKDGGDLNALRALVLSVVYEEMKSLLKIVERLVR